MSKRGVALGGKYPGIYKKTMADGSIRYGILIATTKRGKRRYKYATLPPGSNLQKAINFQKELQAKSTLDLLDFKNNQACLGPLIRTLNAIRSKNKNYKNDCLHIKEIAWFFGNKTISFEAVPHTDVALFFDDPTPLPSIDDIKITEYRSFLNSQPLRGRRQGNLSNQSKDHRLKTLRHLLNLAHKKGLITYRPDIPFFQKLW